MLHQLAVQSTGAGQAAVGSGMVLGFVLAALVALMIVRYVKLLLCLFAGLAVAVVLAGLVEIAPVIAGVIDQFQAGTPS
jgi:hypothetical protein